MPRAAVLLATSLGLGAPGDAPPGLIDPSPAVVGHLELGVIDPSRHVSIALAGAFGRAWYDNTVAPPEGVSAGDSVVITRGALGVVAEGRLPLGRVSPALGAGVYLDHVGATAKGTLLGISGDYYDESDLAPAFELRGGFDWQVHPAADVGLRAGWTWARADLPELTDGGAIGGPSIELRLTIDLTGFRHDARPNPAVP